MQKGCKHIFVILPIRQYCLIRQHIACSGNINLCNYAEFNNLTLNLSVGTKLSIIGGCFPFVHSFITIFEDNSWILTIFWNSFVLNMQISLFYSKTDKTYCHCTNISNNFNNYLNLTLKPKKNKKRIIWIKVIHCGIVLNFILPKSAICCRIRQCCLIGQLTRTVCRTQQVCSQLSFVFLCIWTSYFFDEN